MDWLKQWVKDLVVLVLLAGCLELLLPMNSMKKYVRMTMGLLVMLAITRPLLSFLGQPVTVDTTLFTGDGKSHLPTMSQIMAQAEEFRQRNRTLALQEAQARLGAEAREAAASVEGVQDARATVTLEQTQSEFRIREVTVVITPGGRSGPRGSIRPIEPIKPIEPVKPGQEETPVVGAPPAAREPSEADRELAGAVRREVAARLGIKADPGLIRVLVERQPESQRR